MIFVYYITYCLKNKNYLKMINSNYDWNLPPKVFK